MDLITVATAATTLLPLTSQLGRATLEKCVTAFLATPLSPPIDTVEDLDIHAALRTAQALIHSVQPAKDEDEWEDLSPDTRDVVGVCVLHLKASMLQLQQDVDAYDHATEMHRAKWFASWRRFDPAPHLGLMQRHKRLFDLRFKMLLDVVNVIHKPIY